MKLCATCGKQLRYGRKYCSYRCRWDDPAERAKASENKRGVKNQWYGTGGPMKGRKHTEEHKRMMSARFSGEGNPYYGCKHSEEVRSKLRVPGAAQRKALKKACHGFIWNSLYRVKGFAVNPSYDIDKIVPELGYTARQLAEHLESQFVDGMTWENHSRTGWHIDHIRPICSFPEGTPMSEINALSNLRPLWYRDNLKKAGKWDGEHQPQRI